MATMKDVAKKAGVGTRNYLSRVINNHPSVKGTNQSKSTESYETTVFT